MTTLTVRGTVYTDSDYGPFTVPGAIYTFQNYGPLTTMYTPPPSCTATHRMIFGTMVQDDHPRGWYSMDCASTKYSDCIPTPTAKPITPAEGHRPIGSYYSPGIYCPSGWETVAQAARDGDKPPTTSGAMSLGASLTFPYFPYTPALLARSLQPSETIALCCPSGYTADRLGECWDTVPSYTPTQGCKVIDKTYINYATFTEVYTAYGAERTQLHAISVRTSVSSSTFSISWGFDDVYATMLTPFSSVCAVTLIHHESDIQTAVKGASTTATANAVTQTADTTEVKAVASTSNPAARLRPGISNWEGFGVVLGFSVAAVVLGAAIVLPL